MRDDTPKADPPFTLQPTFGWLEPRHRDAIAAHLQRLDEGDRERRFGRSLSDAELRAFVDTLDFGAQWMIGAFSFDQRLVGFAHACPVRRGRDCTVYAAISVERVCRGRGIGRALLGSVVDRLHQAAATTVVAIGACFELPHDEFDDDAAVIYGPHAYDLCTGVRIEAERLPASRAYRDTVAQAAA